MPEHANATLVTHTTCTTLAIRHEIHVCYPVLSCCYKNRNVKAVYVADLEALYTALTLHMFDKRRRAGSHTSRYAFAAESDFRSVLLQHV